MLAPVGPLGALPLQNTLNLGSLTSPAHANAAQEGSTLSGPAPFPAADADAKSTGPAAPVEAKVEQQARQEQAQQEIKDMAEEVARISEQHEADRAKLELVMQVEQARQRQAIQARLNKKRQRKLGAAHDVTITGGARAPTPAAGSRPAEGAEAKDGAGSPGSLNASSLSQVTTLGVGGSKLAGVGYKSGASSPGGGVGFVSSAMAESSAGGGGRLRGIGYSKNAATETRKWKPMGSEDPNKAMGVNATSMRYLANRGWGTSAMMK